MRRSNSSSHIPLPKIEGRVRSRSSVRTSRDNTGSTKISQIAPPYKRSSSSLYLNRKTVLSTPTVFSSGASSSKKQTPSSYTTPASSRSRSKSPFNFGSTKTERTLNDKKWVMEQYAKVRNYLQEHPNCPDHIADSIKPPTINMFVFVIELLLKEIDPHIKIDMGNYKDLVLNRLKTLHYPGNISNSLLKTVNTMHAWPQIIAIWSWLIDLVSVLKSSELADIPGLEEDLKYKKISCVGDYLIERHSLYNNQEDLEIADKRFSEKIEKVLNIDHDKLRTLKYEVTELRDLKEKQLKQIELQKNANDAVRKEIGTLEFEIETFYMEDDQKEKEFEDISRQLRERRKKLSEAIKTKKENIAKLEETMKSQPCTDADRNKLLRQIDELKHTNHLKRENIATRREIKDNCDLKLAEARKKVEIQVYRLNKELMKLTVTDPGLKILQLRNTGFVAEDFKNEISNVFTNKEMYEKKIYTEIETIKASVSQIKADNDLLVQQIDATNAEIQKLNEQDEELKKQIKKYEEDIENIMQEGRKNIQLIFQEIDKLKEKEVNPSDLDKKLTELCETKKVKENEFNKLKESVQKFFIQLHEENMNYLFTLNEIRTKVLEALEKSLHDINSQEEEILEDLHKLDDLME